MRSFGQVSTLMLDPFIGQWLDEKFSGNESEFLKWLRDKGMIPGNVDEWELAYQQFSAEKTSPVMVSDAKSSWQLMLLVLGGLAVWSIFTAK